MFLQTKKKFIQSLIQISCKIPTQKQSCNIIFSYFQGQISNDLLDVLISGLQ